MSEIRRLRMVAEYLASVRNEIAIEVAFLQAVGKPPDHCGNMPRSPRWLTLSKSALGAVRACAPLVRCAWSLLGFWAFLVVQWIQTRSKVCGTGSRPDNLPAPAMCIFGVSDRAFQAISSTALKDTKLTRLYCPWIAPAIHAHSDPSSIRLLDLLDRSDLWTCLRLARMAHVRLLRTRALRTSILQDYTAFRWFMTRIALTRVSTHWVTTEHYDRWAVLLDGVVKEARRSDRLPPSSENHGFTLIQHGSLDPLSGAGLLPVFPALSYRLSCVSRLHVYSTETGEGFKRYVLSKRGAEQLKELQLFKPTILLSSMEPADADKVVFIGHPACEAFHLGVLAQLQTKPGIHCVYKPHPRSPMSRKAAGASWQVVKEPSFFPECRLAIAYPSTLALEYREAGVPVLQHDMDEPLENAPSIARAACSILENLRSLQIH